MFNAPRVRFSVPQQRAILALIQCFGGVNVPTFRDVQNLQKRLGKLFMGSIRKEKSVIGTVFYLHDIPDIVGRVRGLNSTSLNRILTVTYRIFLIP